MSFDTKKIKFDYAQIGGIRLHYAKAGKGDKLVLLIHGFPEFWYSWRHQLVALSDDYTVIAPDMRGYNWSDKPAAVEEYKVHHLVDDITSLIRHFKREKAFVAGHDWGAGVAWAVAEKHPEYIEKMACLQVPPPFFWRKNFTINQFLASWYMFFFQIPHLPEWFMSRNDYAFMVNALKNSTAQSGVFTDEDLAEYKRSWNEPVALTCMINYYRANVFQRLFGKYDSNFKFKVPTLFIYGEKDHAVLPSTVKGVGEVVDAPFREVRIPNSAHWVQQEAKEIVTESLRGFFADDLAHL
jgi:pimeloyl-ACP methyl ester carboxylesterase